MSEALDPSFDTTSHAGFGQLNRESAEVVAFDNPAAYSRSIRATALVFEDPLSHALHERINRSIGRHFGLLP